MRLFQYSIKYDVQYTSFRNNDYLNIFFFWKRHQLALSEIFPSLNFIIANFTLKSKSSKFYAICIDIVLAMLSVTMSDFAFGYAYIVNMFRFNPTKSRLVTVHKRPITVYWIYKSELSYYIIIVIHYAVFKNFFLLVFNTQIILCSTRGTGSLKTRLRNWRQIMQHTFVGLWKSVEFWYLTPSQIMSRANFFNLFDDIYFLWIINIENN